MRTKAFTPLVAAAAACALGALPGTAAAATTDVQQAASENWSGYVASPSTDTNFKSVSGSWVQPTADCSSGSGYAAFWVGLGGSGADGGSGGYGGSSGYGGSGQTEALEQAGTEADCSSSGQAGYFAWYELVPAAPVRLGLAVKPGDHITTRVGVSGSTVTINLTDVTSGRSAARTLTMSNPDSSSAEWIAEAPSQCSAGVSSCSPLPLTDFGTVKFTGATATTTGGHSGGISDLDWSATQVSLDTGTGAPQFASDTSSSGAGATPSGLGSDGQSFSVAWSGDTSAAGTGPGAGYGDGSGYGPGYGGGSGGGGGTGYGYGDGSGYGPGGSYGYGGSDPYGYGYGRSYGSHGSYGYGGAAAY